MNKKMKLITTALPLLFLQAIGTANASSGDIEAGKIKATTCTGCHGIPNYNNVYPVYKVPKIGGQNEKYLISALQAYKSGERSHATMKAQAESLNQQDIADIAAWFASLK